MSPAGKCLKAFSNGKIPYVIRFHPDEDKQHIFLAGMSDKKIIQVCTLQTLLVIDLLKGFSV
jgi:hypothetical protein